MNRFTLAIVAVVAASSVQTAVAAETWLVTEENVAGVKGSQGAWTVNVDGGAVTGAAAMQSGNGNLLNYTLEGAIEGVNYVVKLKDRTDGKTNCVWSGHPPSGSGTQKTGLIGYAECEGAKLIIRASFVQH